MPEEPVFEKIRRNLRAEREERELNDALVEAGLRRPEWEYANPKYRILTVAQRSEIRKRNNDHPDILVLLEENEVLRSMLARCDPAFVEFCRLLDAEKNHG